jgi:DNA-binding transcriptional LysR family regulator
MNNIPTDLLRTLVTVVDQRSFTKAARSLGLTQPAVSAHIKRLQKLLGSEIFDRSGPGVNLTAKGQAIVDRAREILSINDRIIAEISAGDHPIRIGVPPDFLGGNMPHLLASYRRRQPDLRFSIQPDDLEAQLGAMRCGQLDIAIGLSATEPSAEARHHWAEQMVWLRGRAIRIDPAGPVPLVSFGETCIYHRAAVDAVTRSGRGVEVVFIGPTIASLEAAVSAGLGVAPLPRSRVWSSDLTIWEDAPLPKLPNLFWGIYVRQGPEQELLQDLVDSIGAELHARTLAADKPPAGRNPRSTLVIARRVANG